MIYAWLRVNRGRWVYLGEGGVEHARVVKSTISNSNGPVYAVALRDARVNAIEFSTLVAAKGCVQRAIKERDERYERLLACL